MVQGLHYNILLSHRDTAWDANNSPQLFGPQELPRDSPTNQYPDMMLLLVHFSRGNVIYGDLKFIAHWND